ncbi:MAG: transposase, partial [Gammaproteobacteria bacterium]|jgi:transposase|nr:transposase [Gammaproteobacteria bacterium]
MDAEFSVLYANTGRRSIPPELLLRAILLQVLFTIRSERQLFQKIDVNLLYCWVADSRWMGKLSMSFPLFSTNKGGYLDC